MFDIDRSSPTPLYFQLAQAIEGAITGGDLPAGSRLENEILLAQRYGLSRPTVRRAVQELVDKGLLVRKRGVGTQVIQPHVRRSVELTSLYDDLARDGEAPTTEVLSLERVPAPADIAEELDLVAGEEIVVVHRLRRSHGEAVRARRGVRTLPRPGRARGLLLDTGSARRHCARTGRRERRLRPRRPSGDRLRRAESRGRRRRLPLAP